MNSSVFSQIQFRTTNHKNTRCCYTNSYGPLEQCGDKGVTLWGTSAQTGSAAAKFGFK